MISLYILLGPCPVLIFQLHRFLHFLEFQYSTCQRSSANEELFIVTSNNSSFASSASSSFCYGQPPLQYSVQSSKIRYFRFKLQLLESQPFNRNYLTTSHYIAVTIWSSHVLEYKVIKSIIEYFSTIRRILLLDTRKYNFDLSQIDAENHTNLNANIGML